MRILENYLPLFDPTVHDIVANTPRVSAKSTHAAEEAAYSVFHDELVAHSAEHLLGNEAFINKLVAKDAPLARKIFDKLVDVCKAIGGKGASKTLRTAQKLYIKAAEQSGNTRLAKYFLSHAPEIGLRAPSKAVTRTRSQRS